MRIQLAIGFRERRRWLLLQEGDNENDLGIGLGANGLSTAELAELVETAALTGQLFCPGATGVVSCTFGG